MDMSEQTQIPLQQEEDPIVQATMDALVMQRDRSSNEAAQASAQASVLRKQLEEAQKQLEEVGRELAEAHRTIAEFENAGRETVASKVTEGSGN